MTFHAGHRLWQRMGILETGVPKYPGYLCIYIEREREGLEEFIDVLLNGYVGIVFSNSQISRVNKGSWATFTCATISLDPTL